MQTLKLGNIRNYGEENCQKKIISRIHKKEAYEDLLVELYVADWYKSKKLLVEPIEKEGYPDFRILNKNINKSVFFECKHLRTDNNKRIQKIIKKANSQLLNAIIDSNDNFGSIIILDISNLVQSIQIFHDLSSFQEKGKKIKDEIPDKAKNIIEIISKELSKKTRSINAALVIWDEFFAVENSTKGIFVSYRLMSHAIFNPKYNDLDLNKFSIFDGFTICYFISFDKSIFATHYGHLDEYWIFSEVKPLNFVKAIAANLVDPNFVAIGKEIIIEKP